MIALKRPMLASKSHRFILDLGRLAAALPGIQVHRGIGSVCIPAIERNGFDIKVQFDPDGFVIALDRAILEVSSHVVALQIVEDALTGKIRIKIDTIAGRAWQWSVERLQADGRWATESVSGYLAFRWWREVASFYKMNGIRQIGFGRQEAGAPADAPTTGVPGVFVPSPSYS